MRSFLILSLSAAVLCGCSSVQENPNYEHSTSYRGDVPQSNQYAGNAYSNGQNVYSNGQYVNAGQNNGFAQPASVSYDSPEAQRILAQTGGLDAQPSLLQAASAPAVVTATQPTAIAASPTDSLYAAQEVTGTPGFMAMQNAQLAAQQAAVKQPVTSQAAAYNVPQTLTVTRAPHGAAGTPVAYDYSRNIIAADAVTTGQQLPETRRVLQGASQAAGQNYTVQQGDTVYSLSRRTCVGVNVIQSMNGLSVDYGIKIGQSLALPASVC